MGDVGFLGTGKMGSRMAARLIDAGHSVTVWNRQDEFHDINLGGLVSKGAKRADSPKECAAGKDIVFTSLSDGQALKAVCLSEDGILRSSPAPRLLVDMGTVGPSESKEVAEAARATGISFLRSPVSGSIGLAEAGKLTIMVSGDKTAYEGADPYLASLGEVRFFVGPGENARYLKLIVNMNILVQMQILAESVVLGEKGGLDWRQVFDVIEASVAASPFIKYKIPLLVMRNYEPTSTLKTAHKDMVLALQAAREANAHVPITELLVDLQEKALADGHGDKDLASVALWYEKASGVEPKLVS